MLRRYLFFPIFVLLVFGAARWAKRVENLSQPPQPLDRAPSGASPSLMANRRELIEVLDRLVAYEHYYHSVYGHYTKLLGRLGYSVPSPIRELYDIHVEQATSDRFTLMAFTESGGKTTDLATVDQEAKISANFTLPLPRPEYLRVQAFKHLRTLKDANGGKSLEESGIFRGYFTYEIRTDTQDRKTAVAVGLKPPVVGMQLEVTAAGSENWATYSGNLVEEEFSENPSVVGTGQAPSGNVLNTMEEAYLAQRIFHGETGRYAKDWSELSQIAAFRFEQKDQINPETAEILTEPERKPTSDGRGLVIEAIGPASQ